MTNFDEIPFEGPAGALPQNNCASEVSSNCSGLPHTGAIVENPVVDQDSAPAQSEVILCPWKVRRQVVVISKYAPIQDVTSPTVATEQAAFYLNRKEQTLRAWACAENGPIRPKRINGRLAWSVADIKALLGI